MPRSQYKITNMNNQDNMPLPEASNPIGISPEKNHLAEAENKDFKIAIVDMLKDLKEDMNALLKTVKMQTNS